MSKARLHWFWRGMIAFLIGFAVNWGCSWLVWEFANGWIWPNGMVFALLAGSPALIAAFATYGLLTRPFSLLPSTANSTAAAATTSFAA